MRRLPPLIAALSLLILAPLRANAEDVYWSTKSLLSDFFKSSERVTYVKLETAAAKAELSAMLGYVPSKPSYAVFIARTGERIDGYAVIDEELGQHLPITFGVKMLPTGEVDRLEVMIYREGYGDEIRESRFRRQFVGKRSGDALRFGEDVVAISGATISSKAMATGVRRAVALVNVVKTHALDRATAGAAPEADATAARR
jgi:hypothetical protein